LPIHSGSVNSAISADADRGAPGELRAHATTLPNSPCGRSTSTSTMAEKE